MPNAAETARILFANRRNLVGLGAYSEEDTVSHLIDPALAFLGYPVTHQRRELQSGDNRPDIVLYDAPAAFAGSAAGRPPLFWNPSRSNTTCPAEASRSAESPKTRFAAI